MAISRGVTAALERASWIRRMFEAAHRLRAERGAENVADLSLGRPCSEPPPEFFDALRAEGENRTGLRHTYMGNIGYPEVRAAVAEHLRERTGLPYDADDICMTVGAAGGINILLRSLLDPGDEIVLLQPSFVEYPFYAENFQATCCMVPTRPDFLPDVQRVADACTANTRAVIINSPNNPTGRVFSKKILTELGRALAGRSAALSRPIHLLFDDPYRQIYYGDTPTEMATLYDQTLYVTSFSKDLGLAGERIGYVAIHPGSADRENLRRALPFAQRALGFVNAPAVMQRAVVPLLSGPRDSVRAFYRARRDLVVDGLAAAGLETTPLEGAFYAFPKAPEPDDMAFCRRMLDRGLVLVPGTAFGSPGHFRLSYATTEATLVRGLSMLRDAL